MGEAQGMHEIGVPRASEGPRRGVVSSARRAAREACHEGGGGRAGLSRARARLRARERGRDRGRGRVRFIRESTHRLGFEWYVPA